MGDQPPSSLATKAKTVFTLQLTYRPTQKKFLFIMEAENENDALEIFNSLGYHLYSPQKFFDIQIRKATLLEIYDSRTKTNASPVSPQRQGAATG
jgi:hypothetical protein